MDCETTKLSIETKGLVNDCHASNCASASENSRFISMLYPLLEFIMDKLLCDPEQKIVITYEVCNLPISKNYESLIKDMMYDYHIRMLKNYNSKDWCKLSNEERCRVVLDTQKRAFSTNKIPYYKIFSIQIGKNKSIDNAYDLKTGPEWGINLSIPDPNAKACEESIPKTEVFQKINHLLKAMSREPETVLTEFDIIASAEKKGE